MVNPRAITLSVVKKKSLKKLKCYIRKYSLNIKKKSSKGRIEEQTMRYIKLVLTCY